MKCVLVQADGLGDEPLAELNGKTPLEAAYTPHLDAMASRGILGLVRTIPHGVPASCEAGSLAVLGYDPARYRTGCAPLEAVAHGVTLGPGDVAFRLQLVTVELAEDGSEVLRDPTGGCPEAAEASAIVADLARALEGDGIEVWEGRGYRHGLVWRGGEVRMRTVPPHAIVGTPLAAALPVGPGAERLHGLMRVARDVLARQPACVARRAAGATAPNAVWLWGQGVAVRLPALRERFPVTGAIVAGGDLERGLGRLAGLDVLEAVAAESPGAAVVSVALAALETQDFVLVQLPDADEAGHQGDVAAKVAAIERLDAAVVGPLLDGLRQRGGAWRLAVVPDHPTPCALRTHTADPVPFVLYVAGDEEKAKGQKRAYHERDARELGIFIAEGYTLIERLLRE